MQWPSAPDPDPHDLDIVSSNVIGLYGNPPEFLVVTTEQGLFLQTDSESQIFKAANGLPADEVLSFFLDRGQNAWIGTAAGAVVVSIGTEGMEFIDEFGDEPVFAIYQDGAGMMWFGLAGRVARLNLEFNDWTFFGPEDGLIGWINHTIFEDSHDQLWVASDNGLMRFDGNRFLEYYVPNQPAYSEYSFIVPDQDGDLLLGPLYWGGYSQLNLENGEFEFYEMPEGASPMVVTEGGTIWAGSNYSGLWRVGFDGDERQYSTLEGLPSDMVTTVAIDPAG